jgi:two-component system response regulator TctD
MIVLIIDDDAEVGDTIGELLRRRGHTVTAITSGRQGLALAASTAFDLVILDVRMPEMDGFTLLSALRHQGCKAGVVMLTGNSDVEDAVKASHLGADDYLPKPVRLAALERVISSIAQRRPPARS